MTTYLIKGARRADGTGGDLGIRDGVFVDEPLPGATIIDADGLLALPGLVDLHTHLREPGRETSETIETGTACAARGGFTAVHAMANLTPVTDTAEQAAYQVRRGIEAGNAQVIPVGAVTVGLAGTELAPIAAMASSTARVRVFSDDGKCVMNAQLMRAALEAVKAFDGVVAQHAQDHQLADDAACCAEGPYSRELGLPGWPAVAESAIVARDVQLAQFTGARLHVCHISTAESIEIVRWAKARGVPVTAEVTPHHLYLPTATLCSHDTTFKVNPPLRSAEDIEACRAGLADGTIDIVATDHAPHAAVFKDKPFPLASPGMLGLEQALGVVMETMVNTGRLNWTDIVRVLSWGPARLGRDVGQGLPLLAGNPANLVLVDPTSRKVVDRDATSSLSRNNPYHGHDLPDPVALTMWQGRVTWQR